MTRDDYWDDVKSTVANMWVDYELDGLDGAYDAIHELADNHSTYTSTCNATMQHTNNDDAFTEVGLDGCSSWSEVVSRAAFYAYRQDLIDEAHTWAEEDIFKERKVFRCRDCSEVFPLDDAQDCPTFPDDDEERRCESCHMDYVEMLAEEDDEDDEDEDGEE